MLVSFTGCKTQEDDLNSNFDNYLVSSYAPRGFSRIDGLFVESEIFISKIFINNRSIEIPDMFVCKHKVTRSEYKSVMGTDPSLDSYSDEKKNKPVSNVRWYEAIEYCNKRSEMDGLTPCYDIDKITMMITIGL